VICGGCQRELQAGDLYIEDTPLGYIGKDYPGGDAAWTLADIDALLVDLMTHNDRLDGTSDRLIFCEACTDPTREGRYQLQTYSGEAS
jgi:hypothetical protein